MHIRTALLLLLFAAVSAESATVVRLERTLTAHTEPGRQVAFSPDSRLLASSSVDRTVKLWSVADGRLVRVLRHPAGVTSVAFSADGQWIATGGYDHQARLWRVRDGVLARTFRGHTGTIWSVALSRDGQRLGTGGEDKTARIWRVADGALLHTLSGHALNVWHVAFTPDARYLVSSSFDRTARLWNVADGKQVRIFSGHREAIVGFDISPDGTLLATGSDDSTVRLWRIADGRLLRSIAAGNHIYSVAFSPDGRLIAGSGRESGALGTLWKQVAGSAGRPGVTVRIWSRDGVLRQSLTANRDDVFSVSWSRDGRWLADTSEDETVRLWGVVGR